MSVVNARTPSEYLEFLTVRGNRDAELRLLLNEITIGETYMFRSPAQLEALRTVILPQLIEAKGAMGFKRLRMWSAGCSTGEEPYTLAMFLLEESAKLLAGWAGLIGYPEPEKAYNCRPDSRPGYPREFNCVRRGI